MGPIRSLETSVKDYHSELLNAPEERRSQGQLAFDSRPSCILHPVSFWGASCLIGTGRIFLGDKRKLTPHLNSVTTGLILHFKLAYIFKITALDKANTHFCVLL
jgi:hypothetical protein